ncbi:MAG: DUF3016 domain-containing protein [Rhodanobacteraceae bacterium]|nr:DUF3016 domain-containing protein [Rhodanobacteraceae bacterium]
MYRTNYVTLASLLLLATSVQAAGPTPVSVEFVNAEKFTDVNDRAFKTSPEKNTNLAALRKHVETKGAKYLKAGQTLAISFTDIDLAGDHKPQLRPQMQDVRLVTGLYPPRMSFNFVLKDANGQVLDSGEAKLSDVGFDTHSAGLSSDALRYEKRMLDKWMRAEFGG